MKGITFLSNLKGPSVALMERLNYIKRTNEMVYDSSKFEEVDIKPGTEINFTLQEKLKLVSAIFLKLKIHQV